MKLRVQLAAFLCVFGSIATAWSQTITWQSSPTSGVFGSVLNWQGGIVPTSSNDVIFSTSSNTIIDLLLPASVKSLTFNDANYDLSSSSSSSMTIGSGGVTVAAAASPVHFQATMPIVLGANQTWTLTGNLAVYSGISGSASLTKAGSGDLYILGNATYTGGTTITGGALRIGNGDAAGAVTGSIVNNSELVFDRSGSITYGSISGTGNLTQVGATSSILTLLDGNTYSGTTTITAGGTIAITADSGLGTAPSTPTANSLTLDNGTLKTTGTLTLSSNRGIALGYGGGTISADSGTLTYAGLITGTGCSSLSKDGDGTLILGGANTYSDSTRVVAGTLADTTSGGFSSNSAFYVNSGATLAVNANETLKSLNDDEGGGLVTIASGKTLSLSSWNSSFSGAIGGGSLTLLNGANQRLTGNINLTGGLTINSGARLEIGNGDSSPGTISVLAGITDNGDLKYNLPFGSTVTSPTITGSGNLLKYGGGTIVLSGTNTYSGDTTIEDGFVADANAGAFSPSSRINLDDDPAVLSVNFNETIRGLSGVTSSVVNIAPSATLTLNNSAQIFEGNITGSGAVTITGTKSYQVFSGNNDYSGGTTINGGTLVLTNNGLGSGTGTGNVIIAGGATLQIGDGEIDGSLTGNITNNGTVVYANPGNLTYAGSISGSGRLNVGTLSSGSTGTLTLGGANTFTGGTTIGAGTLRIGAVNALPTSTVLSFSNNGRLDVQNSQQIARFGGTSNNSSIQIASGQTFTVAPTTSIFAGTFAGEISGSGSLTLGATAPTSILLTNNDSSYSGGTTVANGTILVGTSSVMGESTLLSGPLGKGTVTVAGGSGIGASKSATSDITIGNNVTLGASSILSGAGNNNALVLSGIVTVPTTSATVQLANLVEFKGLLQAASGTTALTFSTVSGSSFGTALLLNPPAGSISSITANGAGVVFGSASAVPDFGALTLKASTGYVGIGAIPSYMTPTAASVLSLINTGAFVGTFGFDTGGNHPVPHTFSDSLNVSVFGSNLSLGSLSKAILTGTITPSSAGYIFGNGGGVLFVQSALDQPYGVTVASTTSITDNYLTAVFQGANSFTGNLSVANSLAVLDSASALPTGKTIALGADGYVGYTEAFTGTTSFANFLTRLTSYTSSSVIGLDSHTFTQNGLTSGSPSGQRYNFETLNLSSLNSVYLGTTTGLALYGPISAPNQGGANKTLSLLAGGDGTLVIQSPLTTTGVSSVVLGATTNSFGTGTILLSGQNTYTGGTTLQSGTLVLGNSSKPGIISITSGPVGTGTLTVSANARKPTLAATNNGVSLDNSIALGSILQLGLAGATYSNQSLFGSTYHYGSLTLNGVISNLGANVGALNILDNTTLNGANTFTGGVNWQSGILTLGNDSALGTGTFNISGLTGSSQYALILSSSGNHAIANGIVYNGSYGQTLTLSGGSLTTTGSLILNSGLSLLVSGSTLNLNGAISGGGHLNLMSGTVTYSPTSATTNTGGFESTFGTLILGNSNALPPSSAGNTLKAGVLGYVGISFLPSNVQSDFLDRFYKNGTSGTIGFDSPNVNSPLTYTDPINLTGFNSSVRLGSASAAILAGTITPADNETYSFGGGGGSLTVASNLVNAGLEEGTRSLTVFSADSAPLTLYLSGTNSYSGDTTVINSALVFTSNSAMPSSSSFDVFSGGYIGLKLSGNSTGTDAGVTNFLGHFNTPVFGYVGFDATSGTTLENLDISGFGSDSVGLATTSNLTLSGNLTVDLEAASYRFAGYKGGQLVVTSLLTDGSGPRSVIIGDTDVAATFGSPINSNGTLSSVTLSNANSYTGGTELNAGVLYVGDNSALGTGTLTVASNSLGNQHLGLFAFGGPRILANPISLGTATLDIGGSNNLELTGAISGSGDLNKIGGGLLKLSGTNTGFSGDIYIAGGSITFNGSNSVGTGALEFGIAGGIANFIGSSTINGISADSSLDIINLPAGGTLTVNQTEDATFAGKFAGTAVGLTFMGTPTSGSSVKLNLTAASTYTATGTTTIGNNVVIVAGNNNAFGVSANTVTLNGGKLSTSTGVTVSNPITLTAGKLAGYGTFQMPSGGNPFDIKSSIYLSPGLGGPGTLTFTGTGTTVLMSGGGTYNWQLADAGTGVSNGSDLVIVNGTVDIAATTTSKFNLSIISVNSSGGPNFAVNFDPSLNYSWTIMSASQFTFSGTSGAFNANAFSINTSNFFNPNGGQFSLSLDNTGTNLMLNFSPIPEPSTYALMIAGLGLTGVVAIRRRRRRN